jgi:hypothetical protein
MSCRGLVTDVWPGRDYSRFQGLTFFVKSLYSVSEAAREGIVNFFKGTHRESQAHRHVDPTP